MINFNIKQIIFNLIEKFLNKKLIPIKFHNKKIQIIIVK